MTDVPPPPEPSSRPPADSRTEILGTARHRGRRGLVIGVVAALVVAVLGGGAWAVYSFLSGAGPRPEEALPASTVAVISVDLDPSAGQKIAAIKSIRKFPSLKKALGLRADDDLRKFIYDKATESGDCSGVDFDKNVKPWIGKRAAFGAVDLGGDDPVPVIALQISDRDKAGSGFSRIAKCARAGNDFKWAIGDDYLIASDSQAHADTILKQGKQTPLADDASYRRWHDEAGDAGVLNFYVSKRATKYLSGLVDDLGNDLFGSGSGPSSAFDGGAYTDNGMSGLSAPRHRARTADTPDPLAGLREELDKFQGLAGTVRFADGGMELALAAGGLTEVAPGAPVGEQVAALPGDTVFAIGIGVPKTAAENLTESFRSGAGADSDDMLQYVEDETGLRLPGDLQTLLGDAITLSVGSNAPKDLSEIDGVEDVPIGLVIHGDAVKIKQLIGRIEDHAGIKLSDIPIVVAGDDSRVVLSSSQAYADQLSKKGSLGRMKNFTDAVPDAERATAITYLDFDSAWRDTLLRFAEDDAAGSIDVRVANQNTEPLKSLGVSSWLDGGVSHLLVKIATD